MPKLTKLIRGILRDRFRVVSQAHVLSALLRLDGDDGDDQATAVY